jgi:ABC-type branched-subunit amino acid transport system substrate-binding protein
MPTCEPAAVPAPAAALPPLNPPALLRLPRPPHGARVARLGVSGNLGGHTRELCAGCSAAALEWRGRGPAGLAVRLEWEEDSFDAGLARAAARRLVERGCVAVIGHLSSSAALPAAEVYADAGIPFLAPGSSHPALTGRGHPAVLRLCGRDEAMADAMVQLAAREGARRVALVREEIAWGEMLAALLRRRLADAGLAVAADLPLGPGAANAAAGCDAVLFAGRHEPAARLARELRAAGFAGVLVLGDDAFVADFPLLAGGAAEGARVVSTAVDAAAPGYSAYLRRYRRRAGAPPGAYSATSFLAAWLALAALPALLERGTAAFVRAVRARAAERPTLLGRVRFTPGGDLRGFAWGAYRVERGAFVPHLTPAEER